MLHVLKSWFKRGAFLVLVVGVVVANRRPVVGQEPLPVIFHTEQSVRHVSWQGDCCLLVHDGATLTIWDVDNPTTPLASFSADLHIGKVAWREPWVVMVADVPVADITMRSLVIYRDGQLDYTHYADYTSTWSDDVRLVAELEWNTITIRNIDKGLLVGYWHEPEYDMPIISVWFTPNNGAFVTYGHQLVAQVGGRVLYEVSLPQSVWVRDYAGERLLLGGVQPEPLYPFYLVDATTGRLLQTFTPPDSSPYVDFYHAFLSPSGHWMVYFLNNIDPNAPDPPKLNIVDAITGEPVVTLDTEPYHGSDVSDPPIVWSPDERYVAVREWGARELSVWEWITGTLLFATDEPAYPLAYAAEPDYFFTEGADNSYQIRAFATGEAVVEWQLATIPNYLGVNFSPSGRRYAVVDDTRVLVYTTPSLP